MANEPTPDLPTAEELVRLLFGKPDCNQDDVKRLCEALRKAPHPIYLTPQIVLSWLERPAPGSGHSPNQPLDFVVYTDTAVAQHEVALVRVWDGTTVWGLQAVGGFAFDPSLGVYVGTATAPAGVMEPLTTYYADLWVEGTRYQRNQMGAYYGFR